MDCTTAGPDLSECRKLGRIINLLGGWEKPMVVLCRGFANCEMERRGLSFGDTSDAVRLRAEVLNILFQLIHTSPL